MRSGRRVLSAVLVSTCTIALSSCGASEEPAGRQAGEARTGAEGTFDVVGTVEVEAVHNGRPGAPCRPDEESARWPARPGAVKPPVQVGGQVTVTDASGEVVGLGEVSVGEYVDSGFDVSSDCAMPFQVVGVPEGDQFYGLENFGSGDDATRARP